MTWSSHWDVARISRPNWPQGDKVRDKKALDGPDQGAGAGSFRAALQKHLKPQLQWSRHAEQRLRSSGMQLDQQDLQTIEDAVETLAQRGARDALVVYGQLALIVSVDNRTVVTAATPDRWRDGIFTQIDGAALIQRDGNKGAGPQAGDGYNPFLLAGEALGPRIDGSGPDSGRLEKP